MRTLKLGGLARDWRSVSFHDPEQYVQELLELELKEREANRINRMIKIAGFQVIRTLDEFIWNSQWNTVFGDNRLTAALIDRLIFHSHIVIFSGESYRLTQSMNRQRVGVWKSSVRNTSATVVASRSSLTDARILYASLLQYLRALFFFHSALPRVLFIGFKEF